MARHAGEVVSQDAIFDLRTRSIKKKGYEDVLSDELPRFWIAQIPKFILAYHTRGVFDDIQVQDVRSNVEEWEKSHQAELSRLAALIHRIMNTARERADGKLELCYNGVGKVEVREQMPDAGDVLSAETRATWTRDVCSQKENIAWAAGEADYRAM